MDFSSYKVSVGGFLSFDLCSILSSQPLQIMAKDADSGAAPNWHGGPAGGGGGGGGVRRPRSAGCGRTAAPPAHLPAHSAAHPPRPARPPGDYAYCLLIWHQRLLYPDEAREDEAKERGARRAAAAAARAAAGGGGVLRRLWG
jgi:hypothetical protein